MKLNVTRRTLGDNLALYPVDKPNCHWLSATESVILILERERYTAEQRALRMTVILLSYVKVHFFVRG